MEINVNKMRRAAQLLREHLTSTQATADQYRVLQQFAELKEVKERDVEELLRYVAIKLLDAQLTLPIAIAFEEYLLLILTTAIRNDEAVQEAQVYQQKCVALAKLMGVSLDAKRYASGYFRNKPAPFEATEDRTKDTPAPQSKKSKKNSTDCNTKITELDLIKCCYQLLYADPAYFKELWNWSAFIEKYLQCKQATELQQLYGNHIVAILTNMTVSQLRRLNAKISAKTLLEFDEEQAIPQLQFASNIPENLEDKCINLNLNSDLITNIEGVLLPIYNKDNYNFYTQTDGSYDKIVKVDSTKVNLRSIALGIAAAKAICLSGPVGCGKTTLVEYLARKTGRICPKPQELRAQSQQSKENKLETISKKNNNKKSKDKTAAGNKRKSDLVDLASLEQSMDLSDSPTSGFLRIQLGDQTDSKMLLGQYRCTDVPGEFIWLPGVLTQAVMHGYWLLLEDLDSATQDTYTILSSLLENNALSVPGFRDCVKIAPGFQLFVTVRTNKSSTNSTQKSLYSLLEKYLYTINILPLSRNELCKVIGTNYPKLSTVANRIVDVFLTFSSGDHSVADNLRQQETGDKADTTENYIALPFEQVSLASVPNSGRLVSTRDLVKLCQRSNPMFSVTSTECAYFVFQNAVDVFCSYLPQGKPKTKLIISIGAKLGIIQSRCEFFANEYKPDVQLDSERIKVGRAELFAKSATAVVDNKTPDFESESRATKRQKLTQNTERSLMPLVRKTASTTFSYTRIASCMLERIAVCVAHAEPVLLVGETGVGKTSSVQFLAERTQHKLVVVNMNNQSDVADLVGGFKPVDLTYVITPLRNEFEQLFRQTFNQTKNETFLNKFAICYNQGNFTVIIKLMLKVVNSVFEKQALGELREKELELLPRWQVLKVKLLKLSAQLAKSINISFAFIPGSLVNCIKNGDWVLLDEINLASAETLECLSTILEPDGSVVLLEKGDFTPVKRHADFRIFACMNPNTDIGKKDLSVGIRNRFTEFFVDELTTDADLSLLVSDYLSSTGIQKKSVASIVRLYKQLKQLSRMELNDGLGNRPVFSLRTLCRSLRICAKNLCGSIERNLYESFCMSFLTQLDATSHCIVLQLIKDALLSNAKAVLKQCIPKPGEDYLNFEGYWIQVGEKELQECANYILTDSVRENLKDLARIISIGKLPVLLQGPTSAGKTSLIEYVAKRSGNHCMRINNHEHTDLQEYIGTYAADVTGKLSFKEGVLVQAMRNGYWIILDELNLASTDILEALNRVLDDNRELFIPETQTVVKAHANFMLFATQNPPGLYGGRKTLSRAFKNRFIELHFSEIPRNELEIILEKRCLIPASYAKKMVMCMYDLQKNRLTTSKNVFTLRDLFRWGNRYTYADKKLLADPKYDWNQHLIEEGYLVLSAKVRTRAEIDIIEDALYRNFRKRIDLGRLFDAQSGAEAASPVTRDVIATIRAYKQRSDIVWTRNMTRMAVLTAKALQFNEPVLLVGPTGCGKTTVCQILASMRDVQLRILNCHMHTEGADFLGGLRPCRKTADENGVQQNSTQLFEWADGPLIHAMQEGSYFMADEISLAEDSVLERLNCILEPERTVLLAEKGGVGGDTTEEIARDFVVQAHEGFQFLATMNPGGDFGKKELSPALRNRFTEVWCEPSDSKEDLVQIACKNMQLGAVNAQDIQKIAEYLVEIVLYMRDTIEKFKFSVRDILAWAHYIVANSNLSFPEQAIFGLETIFLDALEMLPHESLAKVEQMKTQIIDFAIKQAALILQQNFSFNDVECKRGVAVEQRTGSFGIAPFYIAINARTSVKANKSFLFEAPTTKQNLFRLLSALTLRKPVLLEGPPGVGKTSTVESLAQAIGYRIVRINLCEHTDLADLFGTDLPAEDNALTVENNAAAESAVAPSSQVGTFVWRDGPLLAALKAENTWILLDELNLAPQSVLEGLNAILDHRGEVYIPELNRTFVLSKQTRIFACQNPLKQGGGRKGLPQSFLNRFNKVYLRKLTTADLLFVVNGKYAPHFEQLHQRFVELLAGVEAPTENLFDLSKVLAQSSNSQLSIAGKSLKHNEYAFDLSARLVKFSEILDNGIAAMEFGYRGGPYEINLRDILRWCDLLVNPETGFICATQNHAKTNSPQLFIKNFQSFLLTLYERMKLVYYQRMRADQDKLYIRNAFAQVFNCDAEHLNALSEDVALYWTGSKIYLNDIVLKRDNDAQALYPLKSQAESPLLLATQREMLKNIIECVHMEKPVLLCGGTDAGKTKLIDAACTLTHQICNTDTIDDSVTGSFQQIDLNRHLEEISQGVEALLMTYLQAAILESGSVKVVAELFNLWSDYNIAAKIQPEFNSTTAMSEELAVFRKRIQKLTTTIDRLLSAPHFNAQANLKQQKQRLKLLQKHIRNAESLNTGGAFEWVDSKIVKSLKCGQYMLLEHVNLCSSAVLDRLNPVFEPNGNLLISEKGVSANESAEIVEKSPNFRALLTIDPKNGELSRAMRNRCVELALSKDAYDIDDMRVLVYTQGVHDIAAINCILQVHARMLSLTEINQYNISHLTQFAFLTTSYKRIGYALERAIYVSGMEVYVYATHNDLLGYGLAYYQNKLREIVLEESEKFAAAAYVADQEDHLANVILNCSALNELSLIKLQAEPLKILLKQPALPQQALGALFKRFEALSRLDELEQATLLKYFIYILYESSSLHDFELRFLYLEKLLNAHPQLKALSANFYTCILQFQQKCPDQLPVELPWNCKLYPRIRDYAAQLISSTNHKAFCLSSLLLVRLLLKDVPAQQQSVKKLYDMSPLTYSQAVATKSITDKLNNAFLQHFASFLTRLQEVLSAALQYAHFDLDTFTQLISGYHWFNRCLQTSQEQLFVGKQLNTDLIDKLLLHFKWLDKHLLHLLETILPNYRQLNAEFESSLQKLTHYALSVKHPLNLVRKVYSKQMTNFQPFYQAEQIKFHDLTKKMDQLLSVVPSYGSFASENVLKKFLAQNLVVTKRAQALTSNMLEQRFDYNFQAKPVNAEYSANIPNELKLQLQQFLTETTETAEAALDPLDLATLQTEVEYIEAYIKSQDELNADNKPKAVELTLLPLREYYLNKSMTQMLNEEAAISQLNINAAYCEELPTLSNASRQLIKLKSMPLYQSFHKLWLYLSNYMAELKTTEEFEALFQYLNGSYRQFTTVQRLILNISYKQQLSNLSTRVSCMNALKTNDEIDCRYVYEGPSLLLALNAIAFENDGSLKPVPLNELDLWKQSLRQVRQLLWQNAALMAPACNVAGNNLGIAKQNAQRLLHEIKYVRKLCENLENENFSDYNENFQKLVQALAVAYEAAAGSAHLVTTASSSSELQQIQYHGGLLNSLIGAIEVCLLTFTPLIDPVEKNELKNRYITEDISTLSTLSTVYDFMKIIMKYKNFGQEIYAALDARLQAVQAKQAKCSQKVALRPSKCLYSRLVQDITHFLVTNCEPQALLQLICGAQQAFTALTARFKSADITQSLEQSTELLNRLDLWITNSQRFVNHILKPYMQHYQDFLQPLQCAIDQLRFGLEALKVVLSQLQAAIVQHTQTQHFVNINEGNRVHKVLANIVEFPTVHTLQLYNVHATRDIMSNHAPILSILEGVPRSEQDYFKLLRAKLTELRNLFNISTCIDEESFREYDFALNVCNQIWQQEEERRKLKKAEDESLYVSKTKCETEDEELVELQEIEEHFPTNVQEDFGEFIAEDTLEKIMKLDKKKDLKTKSVVEVVRAEDYAFLGESFVDIMLQYTRVYYHARSAKAKPEQLQFLDSFKQRMQVYVKLFAHYKLALNEWLDVASYNSYSFAIILQQRLLNEVTLSKQASEQAYNFYKHPNIPEIIGCTDVLGRIEARVDEQLALYPEHASLIDIKRVIARIRTLPSTSPVARFNAGFQILRQKMSQWNEVAHRQNHLRDEEIEVAEYVQKWTRLELQCWRNCLTQTCEKVEATAYKYWFFIYNLLQEYILEHEIDNSYTEMKYTEKRFADGDVLDDVEVAQKTQLASMDIIRILRQFVEASSYGDFDVRMRLLQAFELYLHNIACNTAEDAAANAKKYELIAGLHNMQIYFMQFAKEIEDTKHDMRAPIEKKLREFVKIESYNKDLSYFSMRNNVARVHRNLNKFLKEYQQQLQQKITPVFQPKDATAKDYSFASDKGRELRFDSRIKYYLVDVKHFIAPQKLGETYELPESENPNELLEESAKTALLPKVGRLFRTTRNVVKETVTNAVFPKLIIALDLLLCEQLERCENLRNLNVDRTRERAKQVLEAKQILQQKRKALSDLFKTLTQLGVNYRTGLMELSLRTEFDDVSLPPFCIRSMLRAGKDKHILTSVLHLNENLDNYYAKCVFKLRLLQNIMLTPLSELGPPNIERIKGYAIDLFLLVQNQRALLASTTKRIYDLRGLLTQLQEVAAISKREAVTEESLEFLKTRDTYLAIKQSITHIRFVFEQFKLLLNCVPNGLQPENQALEHMDASLQQDSASFSAVSKQCDSVLELSKNALSNMLKDDTEFLSIEKLAVHQQLHAQLVAEIKQLCEVFRISEGAYLPIAKPLSELLEFVRGVTNNVTEVAVEASKEAPNFENIDAELENVLHAVLISLQKLYKKYPKPQPNGAPSDESSPSRRKADAEADEHAIEEHHLKRKLYAELLADWETLNMSSTVAKLSNIMLTLKHADCSSRKLSYARKVSTLLPILEQYNLLADYYLFQQLGAHKVSAKMLSVMLTVFVEISTKGFCVPADLMQDEEGEAKKDQKEGEGFGLEDGTGEKDASDKIESEDQLDDAKRPEDRKDEGDKQQPDCKEEKGIEMSDDFDGKMQDIEKPENEEDDSAESEQEDDELNKEMGETEEGADKLDDQIWGDDEEEEPEENEQEMNEEDDGKGSKDEKDAHNDLDTKNDKAKNDGEDEHDKDGLDATNEPSGEDKRKQQEKDIDNMKEPEVDEEQVNPYHNELEEPPEPEEMDLGDMNNVDEAQENGEEQQGDENPFDIDRMKENMPTAEEDNEGQDNKKDEQQDGEKAEENESSGDESDTEIADAGEVKQAENEEIEQPEAEPDKEEEAETQRRGELENEEAEEQPENEATEKHEEKPEEHQQSKDKASKEENVQSVPETETKGSADQVQDEEQNDKDVKQEQKMDEQETGEEKEGVGQAENEADDGGHQGVAETKETVSKEESKNERKTEEKRKQGRTNEERTLGEAEKNKLKQLKTIDKLKEQHENQKDDAEPEEEEMEAEEYQHVKEPKNSDKTTLDNATEEQSKQIKHQEDEPTNDEEMEDGATNDEVMDEEVKQDKEDTDKLEEMSAEKFDQKSDKPSKSEKTNERAEAQEPMEVEGEVVQTMSVPRGDETTAHCIQEILLDNATQAQELSTAETLELRKMYQQQLTSNSASMPQHADYETWQTISNRMAQNARELCEQLRLILEPTKCTRLKGDYRTGRRINMKKIIPYIASQFRKDKIWLRRTKPAQRDYKITIAIDDSKSMHHNNSKTLTLEAISLVSQALTLLESGRLSIVSFGESPQIILNHTAQFDGPKLVNALNFAQDKTKIAELLDFVRTVNTEEGAMGSSDNGLFENLLLVLSDGRNIFSEGKIKVKNAIKLARLQRMFLVYIIIDNPENKNSILDIQTMEMLPDKSINIKAYLDDFPFPYYVIVRDLNQLPLVLSEAMRQWFELVNSEQ